MSGPSNFSPHLLVSIPPPVRSDLVVGSVMRLECVEPPPNLWRRVWYWALLGWKGEEQ